VSAEVLITLTDLQGHLR